MTIFIPQTSTGNFPDTRQAANAAARLAGQDDIGQFVRDQDTGKVFMQLASPASSAANWYEVSSAPEVLLSTSDLSGNVPAGNKIGVNTANGKIFIANNANPAQWVEYSGGKYKGEWAQAPAYRKDDMVVRTDGIVYVANDAIPANTAFAEGTTGATWKKVGGSGKYKGPHVQADAYKSGDLVFLPFTATTDTGGLYRANSDIAANTAFVEGTAANQWARADERNILRGEWVQANQYRFGDIVLRNGELFSAASAIPAGTAFVRGTGTTGTAVWNPVVRGGRHQGPFLQSTNKAYEQGDVVYHGDEEYIANADIPANTAFAIGTSGATWRLVKQANLSKTVTQNAHGFVVGQPVRETASNTYAAAHAGSAGNEARGVVTRVVSANTFEVTFQGRVTATGHGFTDDNTYWLPNAAGVATITKPSAGTTQAVFTVIDANTLYVHDRQAVQPGGASNQTLARASVRNAGSVTLSTTETDILSIQLPQAGTYLLLGDATCAMFHSSDVEVSFAIRITDNANNEIDDSAAITSLDHFQSPQNDRWAPHLATHAVVTVSAASTVKMRGIVGFNTTERVIAPTAAKLRYVQMPDTSVVPASAIPANDEVQVMLGELVSNTNIVQNPGVASNFLLGGQTWAGLNSNTDYEEYRLDVTYEDADARHHAGSHFFKRTDNFEVGQALSYATSNSAGDWQIRLDIGASLAGGQVIPRGDGDWEGVILRLYGIKKQYRVLPSGSVPVTHDQNNYLDIGNKRIQWGTGASTGAISLPQPFADTNYAVSGAAEAAGSICEMAFHSKSTTGFSVRTYIGRSTGNNDLTVTNQIQWTAVGNKP